MNLLLLRPEELLADGTARLTGRRLLHAQEVLKAQQGGALRVGVLGGDAGNGEVLSLDDSALVLRVALGGAPPPRAGVDLLLALPRPKALKKILPALASFGVGRIVLVNAARVEKSFFSSPVLRPAALEELLCLGLEQARDTRLPEVIVRDRLKPFVEDELDALFAGQPVRLLAHPVAPPLRGVLTAAISAASGPPSGPRDPAAPAAPAAPAPAPPLVLAIGPEGGWVPFELELLGAHGFSPVSLGARPLRTEVAISALLGAISALRQ